LLPPLLLPLLPLLLLLLLPPPLLLLVPLLAAPSTSPALTTGPNKARSALPFRMYVRLNECLATCVPIWETVCCNISAKAAASARIISAHFNTAAERPSWTLFGIRAATRIPERSVSATVEAARYPSRSAAANAYADGDTLTIFASDRTPPNCSVGKR